MDEHERELLNEMELDETFDRWERVLQSEYSQDGQEQVLKLALAEIAQVGGPDCRHHVLVTGWLLSLYEDQGRLAEAQELAREYWPRMVGFYNDKPQVWLAWAAQAESEGHIYVALYLVKTTTRYLIEAVGPQNRILQDARDFLGRLLRQKDDADGRKLLNYRYPSKH